MQRKVFAVLGVATIALLMSGCSKKATNNGGEIVGGEVGTIAVTATDGEGEFAYEIDAEGVQGGIVNIALANEGEAGHDFQLVAEAEGHTVEELAASVADAEAPFEDWILPAGGVGSTAAGASREVTVALSPGTYWYFCTESSQVDGEEVAHGTSGMLGELTIEGDNAAALPETDASIVASEYTFTTEGLAAGTQSVLFENSGDYSHHVVVAPMNEGATIEEVEAFMSSEGEGEPPVDFEGMRASSVVGPGGRMVLEFDFEAGTNYVMLCFLPDPGTSEPPHAALGMLTETAIS